ncbi:hypothetical protein PVAP13_3KG402801 [Panicum virgatum]|uniref:Uncharacterized protein n=1 Tax=Panicum virgatum TaxID=38727 RepID=A0A8T0UY87_PANVG|nr:hypothetical protein PVAP13_3KG402801 [Panicum virgatum]
MQAHSRSGSGAHRLPEASAFPSADSPSPRRIRRPGARSVLARQTRVAAVETTLVPPGKMPGTTGPLLPPALLPGTPPLSPLLDSFPAGTQSCTICPAVPTKPTCSTHYLCHPRHGLLHFFFAELCIA